MNNVCIFENRALEIIVISQKCIFETNNKFANTLYVFKEQ